MADSLPVLLSLHGGGDDAEFNMQYTNFSAIAESDSFITIFSHKDIFTVTKRLQDGIQKVMALMMFFL